MTEGRRFLVRGLLGQGGFGHVYLADMVSMGGFRKEVALKVLDPRMTAHNDAAVRLRDEARLLGLLRHRNIVAVDDLVRFDEGWGVVMEYVPGVDLGVLLTSCVQDQHAFPPLAAAGVVQGVARALEAAYNHAPSGDAPLRAIHRDIKPSNVRITAEGEVKVLDFGIARAEFQAREAITRDSNFGSLAYMSPERVMGDTDSAAGDIYALGVVLWECLAGRPRGRALLREKDHDGQVAEMLAAVQAHPALLALIAEMVAYETEDRPDATTVGARLRAVSADLAGPDLETLARQRVPTILATAGALKPTAMTELVPWTGSGEVGATLDLAGFEPTPTAVPTHTIEIPPAPAPAKASPGLVVGLVLLGLVIVGGSVGLGLWLRGAPASTAAAPPLTAAPAEGVPSAPVSPEPVEVVPAEAVPVEAAPVEAAPETAAAPKSAASKTASSKTPSAPPKTSAPSVPEASPTQRLRAVKFAASGVDHVDARCGDVSGSGASSALVRDLPKGPCTITVQHGGAVLTTTVQVDVPRGYQCAVSEGALGCR